MAIERDRREHSLNLALERHKCLLKEMNHRIKNSLAIASSVLALQARQADNPAVTAQLKEAVHRISAIAKAHESLYQGSEIEWLDIGRYIETVCKDLGASIPGYKFRCNVDYGVEIATDHAISAALIVNELVTNAVKYAYPNKRGEIWITLSCFGDTGFSICVRDNGVGLPRDFDPQNASGLGMRLVKALVQQLHGTLEVQAVDPGTQFCIIVPNSHRVLPGEQRAAELLTDKR
jgi:two-component sensor histidine kinase